MPSKIYQPEFTQKDIQITEKNVVYQGYLRVLRYQLRYRLFSGGWSDEISRELIEAHPAVGVLLFDPVRDEILLIEQFRLGALHSQQAQSPWLLELVAGVIEPNESLSEVAKRETQEEAGCEILALMPICEYLTSSAISTGKFILFCGKINTEQAGGIFGLSHEHEDIRAHVFPKEKVYHFLQTNQITNAATIIALQWLKINEQKVKNQWL